MSELELYQGWQKEWVAFHNVEIGDEVKVIANTVDYHLGWDNIWCMDDQIGKKLTIIKIPDDSISLNNKVFGRFNYPFFCLEYIGKPEKKVEITIEMNGEKVDPKTFSKETWNNLRK